MYSADSREKKGARCLLHSEAKAEIFEFVSSRSGWAHSETLSRKQTSWLPRWLRERVEDVLVVLA